MKCVDCNLKKFQECNGGCNRYWTSGCTKAEWTGVDLQDRAAFHGADD